MYKVRSIADGMIIWKGNVIVGVKGMTLPEMFDDCDCYKLPGNAFDYALAPNQEFTFEQATYIAKAAGEDNSDEEYSDDELDDDYDDEDAVNRVVDTMNDIAVYGLYDDLPF